MFSKNESPTPIKITGTRNANGVLAPGRCLIAPIICVTVRAEYFPSPTRAVSRGENIFFAVLRPYWR